MYPYEGLADREQSWSSRQMNVKLIRAFIASPGGLNAERTAAQAAAKEVNRSVARPLGGRIELIGWEETLSGNGRGQALINADMETCELFIGLIWDTWGSRPALDGPYTSGFEEEFELSRERHRRTSSPKMALFFKAVSQAQERDPGADYKKVIAFQEKLKAEKSFLYSTFDQTEQFASKVREFLSEHVIRILRADDGPTDGGPLSATDKRSPSKIDDAASDDADKGGAKFLARFSSTLVDRRDPSAIEVARLRLIAAAAEKPGNDQSTIGVHDANLVYINRAAFTLSFAEMRGLAEAGLVHFDSQNTPIWTWLADIDRERPGILFAFTAFGEVAQRTGALKALRLLGRPLSSVKAIEPAKCLSSWFDKSSPSEVRLAALAYLAKQGALDVLPTVEAEAQSGAKETVAAAIEAVLQIMLRYDEHRAASYLVSTSFETLSTTVLQAALPTMAQLGPDDLAKGLDHRAPEVRAKTVEILSERGMLQFDTIDRAKIDESPIVRLAAVKALDRLGQPLSLDEAEETLCRSRRVANHLFTPSDRDGIGEIYFDVYRADRLRTMSVEPLKALIGAERHRDAAYRALGARQIGENGVALREDVADGFQQYFARHWPLGIPQPKNVSLLSIGRGDPDAAKRNELTREALDVIADQRSVSDLALVRSVLDRKAFTPSTAVLGYLQAFGDSSDIERVGEASRYSWPSLVLEPLRTPLDAAARLILRWAADRLDDPAMELLPEEMRVRTVELMPSTQFSRLTDEAVVALLLTKSDLLRRASAMQAAASLSRARIQRILVAYDASPDGIYYLVRHWLDLRLAFPSITARQVVAATRVG